MQEGGVDEGEGKRERKKGGRREEEVHEGSIVRGHWHSSRSKEGLGGGHRRSERIAARLAIYRSNPPRSDGGT
jgi:hypothetical protein